MPLEPVETNRPATSRPSTVASNLVGPDHLASSEPSTMALKLAEIGRPTPIKPSAVPPESAGGGYFDSFEPSELREGSKRQRANEERSRSGKPTPKHPRMMASR